MDSRISMIFFSNTWMLLNDTNCLRLSLQWYFPPLGSCLTDAYVIVIHRLALLPNSWHTNAVHSNAWSLIIIILHWTIGCITLNSIIHGDNKTFPYPPPPSASISVSTMAIFISIVEPWWTEIQQFIINCSCRGPSECDNDMTNNTSALKPDPNMTQNFMVDTSTRECEDH